MNSGYDTLKKRRFVSHETIPLIRPGCYGDEVCGYEIPSINRIHEVFGHFV